MQKKYLLFIFYLLVAVVVSADCFARVCFLANGKLCDDDGTADNDIYKCTGDNCSTICDGELYFSLKRFTIDSIKSYATQHGYVYLGTKNVTKNGKSETCYELGCKDNLTSLSACESKYGKECCMIPGNNHCYQKCSLCTTNRIGRGYFPYNDDNLKGCSFIGSDGIAAYTTDAGAVLGRRINGFVGLLLKSEKDTEISAEDGENIGIPWTEEKVWKCDDDCLCNKIRECENVSTQIVDGSTVKGVYCNQGTRYSLYGKCNTATPTAPASNISTIGDKLYCSQNCMICNELRGYYADSNKCQALNDGRICSVSHEHAEFKESMCYYINGNCQKFTNDYYTFDKEGSKINNACYPIPADGLPDPKGRFVYHGDETEKCYYCECKTNDVNVNTCNWLSCNAAVYSSHSISNQSCDYMGYNLAKSAVNHSLNDYICSACPFDATKWKCVRKYD